jgi:hypothetical protein
MFTKLYLNTTDPNLQFYQLFQKQIIIPMIFSILFHTVVYTSFFNLASYIFLNKLLSKQINTRLILSLLVIMFFGFIGRFFHVKDVYKGYNENYEKTRNHLDKLYISWIFIS